MLAAGLLAAPALAASTAPSAVSVTITAKTLEPPIGGKVIVFFRAGRFSSAVISGSITGGVSGDVATLFAQQFPYKKQPVKVGSPVTISGSPASYSFKVAPTIATRYQVKVSTAGAPGTVVGTSAVQTVYVSPGGSVSPIHNCTQRDRPVCHQKLTLFTVVPKAAFRVLSAKHFIFYFGIKLAPHSEPGPPKFLFIDPHARISAARRVSATKFKTTITWSFTVNNEGYQWNWTACVKDTEAKDGYGLPGHHHCGDHRLPNGKFVYLG